MSIRPIVDVAVIGAGTAGAIAGIAAARTGAKTLLVDQYGHLGGMMSTGMALLGVLDGRGNRALGGIGHELLNRLLEMGGSAPSYVDPLLGSVTAVEPEPLKVTLIDMYSEAGGTLLLHSFVSDVLLNENRLSGVIAENKSGRQVIPAKVVIDCTGDGDVAARAGAFVVKGRPEDGQMQPASLIFRLGNVEVDRMLGYLREHPEEISAPEGFTGTSITEEQLHKPGVHVDAFPTLIRGALEAGDYRPPRERIGVSTLPGRNEVTINATRLQGIDGTNVDDLTRAEVETSRQMLEVLRFLRKYVPGFERATVASVPFHVGIRETRHVLGHYELTADDVVAGRDFEDTVARGAYPLDIHDLRQDALTMGHQVTGHGVTLMRLDRSYGIPYRSLVPRGIENLLVAGRCISATHEAAGSVRGIAVCMATGHAAGSAAALSAMGDVAPKELDVMALRSLLRKQKQVLECDESEDSV